MRLETVVPALISKSSVTGRWALKISTVVILVLLVLFVPAIHDFLAVNDPVLANVLVIEAWAWQSSAMQEAVKEFNRGRYDVLLTVGVLSREQRNGLIQVNSAVRAAEQMRKLGVDDNAIQVLAVHGIDRHRTYASALAVKRWLEKSKIDVLGINVFTLGAHAKKSLVLFKRALG